MNSALMFSRASDEWSTPDAFFKPLAVEFDLCVDAAATVENRKFPDYFGLDHRREECRDALSADWKQFGSLSRIWCNPPYSKCREFVAKAAAERQRGVLTVMLIPSRTDTRWFHEHLWQGGPFGHHGPRPGIYIRFVRGRLKFGDGKNGAPFPSMVVVFRP